MQIIHTLIIDTDSYSGNFERNLTAWIFGAVDESDVGFALIEPRQEQGFDKCLDEVFNHETGDGTLLTQQPDSWWAWSSITDDLQGSVNSVEFHFNKPLRDDQLEAVKKQCKSFNAIMSLFPGSYSPIEFKSLRVGNIENRASASFVYEF